MGLQGSSYHLDDRGVARVAPRGEASGRFPRTGSRCGIAGGEVGGGLFVEIADGFELWTAYNAVLLALYEQYGFPLIEFTDPPSTLAQLQRIYGALRLAAPKAEFFTQELVNQRRSEAEVPGVARALHEQLRAARAEWYRRADR